jgi:two-component system, cell cycle response regulator
MISELSTCPKSAESVSDDSTFTESAGLTFRTPERIPVRSANQQACLVHIYPTGQQMGARYPLGEKPVVIGRNDDCAIKNSDASVSRNHARIIREDDGTYSVFDLGSTNGTCVNNVSRRESPLRDGDSLRVGNCIYRFLAGGNIEADYHEEIYRLTIEDGLTQVYNRRYLTEFLEREVTRTVRHERSLAVILLDIDHFKSVNDTLGHLAGDMALRELCARVRGVVRQDELLARYGGEEFAIVLPEANAATARATAERIRLLVEQQPFAFNDHRYPLTISVGVAVIPEGESPTVTALLNQADKNLYRAKQAGRNRVVMS